MYQGVDIILYRFFEKAEKRIEPAIADIIRLASSLD